MKPLKGPELKLGKPQVPVFLVNLYYDLRDRRLLPLVALFVVAILAVPFLLGGDSGEAPEPAATSPTGSAQETGTPTLTVVEAEPGLRDYRKRLRGRTSTDPFKQPSAGAPSASSAASTQTASTSSTTSVSVTSESTSPSSADAGTPPSSTATSPPVAAPPAGGPASPAGKGDSAPQQSSPGSGGSPGGDGSKDAAKPPQVTLYSFGIDVTIVHSSGSKAAGDKQTSEPDVRKRVLPTTSLPGKRVEVVTYLGLGPKTRKPLFLVSTDVTGVFGEGKCVAGSDRCQLIELELGMPEVFEYGEKGDRYKVTATNVQFIATGHS
ncbi:MAG: hypothetical protein WA862_02635 [Solirubrobacterales bacterium]